MSSDLRSVVRGEGPSRDEDPRPDHRGERVKVEVPDEGPSVPATVAPGAYGAPQSRSRLLSRAILILADVVALGLAVLAAYLVRQSVPDLGLAGDLSEAVTRGSPIIALGWIGAIAACGGYDMRLIAAGPEMLRNIVRASLGAAGVIGLVLYLADLELSRAFFVVLFVVGPLLLLVNRFVMRRVIGWLRRRGRMRSRVLVVGAMPYIDAIARTVQREAWLGYDVIGAVIPPADPRVSSRAGIPVVGHENHLLEVVRAVQPAVLLFAAGSSASAEEFRRTAWQLEDLDLDVIIVPGLTDISSDRMSMRPVAGLPLVHLDLPRARDAVRTGKRVFDVACSALGLLLISPVLAAIAIVVKLHDGGPVLFRQERVGRDGVPFEFLKFRSMVPDAEARLADLQATLQDRGNDVMFKMADDPRITRPGRFLRRYSLDELPQLWNVLRGDMSLVGPRPALPREVSGYDEDARRRLTVRPGITGLWQVSGRSDLSWTETVRLDIYYVDNWSFAQDVQILVKTVRAVLSSSGAY